MCKKIKTAILIIIMWSGAFNAQAQISKGINISDISADDGTLSFTISWYRDSVQTQQFDTVWVCADYYEKGTLTRLSLASGATLTTTSAPGVSKIETVAGNNKGVYVIGNARAAGSFTAQVKLLSGITIGSGAVVHANNRLPEGTWIIPQEQLRFKGKRPFKVRLVSGRELLVGVSFAIPAGDDFESFSDAYGAPGKIKN